MSVPSPNTERRPGIRRGAIPSARGPDGRAFCLRAPITEGKREYTRSGHPSQKGREPHRKTLCRIRKCMGSLSLNLILAIAKARSRCVTRSPCTPPCSSSARSKHSGMPIRHARSVKTGGAEG
eukprot:1085975-Prorocentrum_minimum.AAC.1